MSTFKIALLLVVDSDLHDEPIGLELFRGDGDMALDDLETVTADAMRAVADLLESGEDCFTPIELHGREPDQW